MNTVQRLTVCAVIALLGCPAQAQEGNIGPGQDPFGGPTGNQTAGLALLMDGKQAEPEPDERQIVRVYDIGDLLVLPMPYPAQLESDLSREQRAIFSGSLAPKGVGFSGMVGGMGGLGGGGGGGMGGMGGGGFFNAPAQIQSPQSAVLQQAGTAAPAESALPQAAMGRLSLSQHDLLIGLITSTIAPDTWDDVGGRGSINGLGQTLVISQTASVHEQVAALLQALRDNPGNRRTLTLHAYWLWQTDEQVAELQRSSGKGLPRGVVPPDRFQQWRSAEAPEGVRHYLASITCYNGQTVHVQAGSQSLHVTGINPVVGSESAYGPQVSLVQEGAVLQVTPTYCASDNQVTLDLHSRVTILQPSEQVGRQAESGNLPLQSATAIDKPVLHMQRLSTTTRLATDQITLIGGMSFAEQTEARNLYLYVLVSLSE